MLESCGTTDVYLVKSNVPAVEHSRDDFLVSFNTRQLAGREGFEPSRGVSP